jgi:hypothetical protein
LPDLLAFSRSAPHPLPFFAHALFAFDRLPSMAKGTLR